MPALRDPVTGRFVSTNTGGDPHVERQIRADVQIRWFDREMRRNLRVGLAGRLKLAAQLLRDKTVLNLSKPVRKFKGPRSGRIQVDPASRSKEGEFPRADTTRLMKDIFWRMEGQASAIVGTTLAYGLLLETKMNRSFLRRTLNQMLPTIRRVILTNRGGRLPGQEPP